MASYYYNSHDTRSRDQISRGIVICAWFVLILLPFDLIALAKIGDSGSWLPLSFVLIVITAGSLGRLAANYWLRKDAPEKPRGTRQLV
jgi:hypothetical protein